jgi:hypothetical protein
MEIKIEDIRANHQKIVDHHRRYKTRNTVLTVLMVVSALCAIVYTLVQSSSSGVGGGCRSTFCQVSPWLLMAILISIVVVGALALRNKERGITAYSEAMKILNK